MIQAEMFQYMLDIAINEEETEENTALVHSEGLCGHG